MDRTDDINGMVDQFNALLAEMKGWRLDENTARDNVSRCAGELRELRKDIYATVLVCVGPEEKEFVIRKPDYPRAGVGG